MWYNAVIVQSFVQCKGFFYSAATALSRPKLHCNFNSSSTSPPTILGQCHDKKNHKSVLLPARDSRREVPQDEKDKKWQSVTVIQFIFNTIDYYAYFNDFAVNLCLKGASRHGAITDLWFYLSWHWLKMMGGFSLLFAFQKPLKMLFSRKLEKFSHLLQGDSYKDRTET